MRNATICEANYLKLAAARHDSTNSEEHKGKPNSCKPIKRKQMNTKKDQTEADIRNGNEHKGRSNKSRHTENTEEHKERPNRSRHNERK